VTVRVFINGFGRIGRNVLRAIVESKREDIEIVGINDLGPVETNAHLLRFDSVHGRFPAQVSVDGDNMVVAGRSIGVTAIGDPGDLPHKALGIDIAMECTGIFNTRDKAAKHLVAGAKRVIVSAPAEGADLTMVFGVNHHRLAKNHLVISNASCTTNCLAPVAKVLIVVAKDFAAGASHTVADVSAVPEDAMILDIGPETVADIKELFGDLKTLSLERPRRSIRDRTVRMRHIRTRQSGRATDTSRKTSDRSRWRRHRSGARNCRCD
jgi:glyceraldehyde-3-phosphate dehydrogenase type I